MGNIVGGFIWTLVFGAVLFRKAWLDDEPDARAFKVTMAAFVLTTILASIGYGNPMAGIFYAPGAIGAYFVLRHGYRKAWIEDDSTADEK